jgi:hypothetical protein
MIKHYLVPSNYRCICNIKIIAILLLVIYPFDSLASHRIIDLDIIEIIEDTTSNTFNSEFNSTHDRYWLGGDYWANPLEDWRIKDGRLETTSTGSNRNVHLLTHLLGTARGSFTMSVELGALEVGEMGSAGFMVGVREPEINDHRSNVFYGEGLGAYIKVNGDLILAGNQKEMLTRPPLENLKLILSGEPVMHTYKLSLRVIDLQTGTELDRIEVDEIQGDQLVGNIALVNNHNSEGSRFWFKNWKISGSKIASFPARKFGPILWSMYSLNDTRQEDGYVLKISAQFPPLGDKDSHSVILQIKREDIWETVGQEKIDSDARNAMFRIPHWTADADIPYRLLYETEDKNGKIVNDEWTGIIQKDPRNSDEITIASLNCQHYNGFPYQPIVDNIKEINPDLLTFHGDQLYESNGGYGVIRDVAEQGFERATLNYLRKFYMFGWAFRDVMHSRPTIVMTDDHDVFQGNIWGEGGEAAISTDASTSSGYIMPPDWVNIVHRTQTGHNPDPYDPKPIKQNIKPWYAEMVYGGISFAVISERMFKSGPSTVNMREGRADLIETPDFDPELLDKQELSLLGERQSIFLENWIEDWSGAEMKIVLGQTPYANLNTHSGPNGERLYADLDSNGWPQTPRNNALRIFRKGFVFHLNGDQHLPTVTHYGIDKPRDAGWGFCPPGVSVGWPRWWMADQVGFDVQNRPEHGLPNTGQYIGPFGHPNYLYSVGNPITLDGVNRYVRAHNKSSGFGVVRVNTHERTIRMEAYRFLAKIGNEAIDNQFPGWPVTITQLDNYGKNRIGYLQEVSHPDSNQPVVKVFDSETDRLIYALRAPTNTFRPFVFDQGIYRVEIGDPEDVDSIEIYDNLNIINRTY